MPLILHAVEELPVAQWKGDSLSAGTLTTSSAGTGDTAFTSLSATTSVVASGVRSPRLQIPAATANSYFGWNSTVLGTLTNYKVVAYVELPSSTGTASWGVLSGSLGATIQWRVDIAGPGATVPASLRLRNATTQVAESTQGLSANTLYRFEVTVFAGSATVLVYAGDTDTVAAGPVKGTITGTTITDVRFGNFTSSTGAPAALYDEVSVSPASNTVTPVTVTRPVTWDTQQRLLKFRTINADTRAQVGASRQVLFEAKTSVAATRSIVFDVGSLVTKFRTTTFNTLESIGVDRQVHWDVGVRVTKFRTINYNVASPITTVVVTRDLLWDVSGRVTRFRTINYNVNSSGVTTTRQIVFDTRFWLVKTRTTTFNTRALVTTPRTLLWDTQGRVTAARVAIWNTDTTGRVTTSRELLWAVEVVPPGPIVPPDLPVVLQPAQGLLVVVRNQALQRVGAVNVTALTFTKRFNDVGEWSVTVHADTASAEALKAPGAGIMIYSSHDLSEPLLTGPVRERVLTFTDEGYELTASGPDDNVWLADKVAWQMPARTVPNQGTPSLGATMHDSRNGAAETVIKGYVEANLGQSALTARRRVVVEPVAGTPRGATIRKQARMTPLLDMLKDAAAVGGLGYRVKQVGTSLSFDVYVPADKTGTVRFSRRLGNLEAFHLTETAPTASYVIAGGQGEGVTRTFRDAIDSGAIAAWPDTRVERYIDQRQTDDADELEQALLEELISGGPTTSLAITTRDIPQIQFAKHYFVGDKVAVEPGNGQVIKEVLREVTVNWTAEDGVQTVTRVGSYDTTGTSRIQKRLDKIRKDDSGVNTVE